MQPGKLRYLNVSYLGLDGSLSHKDTCSDTAALTHTIEVLKDLRWLTTAARHASKSAVAFGTKLMEAYPKLKVNTLGSALGSVYLRELCVKGKLWED